MRYIDPQFKTATTRPTGAAVGIALATIFCCLALIVRTLPGGEPVSSGAKGAAARNDSSDGSATASDGEGSTLRPLIPSPPGAPAETPIVAPTRVSRPPQPAPKSVEPPPDAPSATASDEDAPPAAAPPPLPTPSDSKPTADSPDLPSVVRSPADAAAAAGVGFKTSESLPAVPPLKIEPARFKNIQPGSTTPDELIKHWGEGTLSRRPDGSVVRIYKIDPYLRGWPSR